LIPSPFYGLHHTIPPKSGQSISLYTKDEKEAKEEVLLLKLLFFHGPIPPSLMAFQRDFQLDPLLEKSLCQEEQNGRKVFSNGQGVSKLKLR